MGSYRVELASTSRATCNAPACKKNKVKITKGELRLGSWVEAEKFQSWSWRHWGCTTTKVIQNIANAIEENGSPNFELLDGLEELSPEDQDKVKKALTEGDIAESDKTVRDDEAGAETAEKPSKGTKAASKTKKRARADDEEETDEVVSKKKTKKSNGKVAGKEESSDEKPVKRGRARKVAEEPVEEAEDAPKKVMGRKKKAVAEEDDAEPEAQPAAKKARKETANGEKGKRGRPKKASAKDEE